VQLQLQLGQNSQPLARCAIGRRLWQNLRSPKLSRRTHCCLIRNSSLSEVVHSYPCAGMQPDHVTYPHCLPPPSLSHKMLSFISHVQSDSCSKLLAMYKLVLHSIIFHRSLRRLSSSHFADAIIHFTVISFSVLDEQLSRVNSNAAFLQSFPHIYSLFSLPSR